MCIVLHSDKATWLDVATTVILLFQVLPFSAFDVCLKQCGYVFWWWIQAHQSNLLFRLHDLQAFCPANDILVFCKSVELWWYYRCLKSLIEIGKQSSESSTYTFLHFLPQYRSLIGNCVGEYGSKQTSYFDTYYCLAVSLKSDAKVWQQCVDEHTADEITRDKLQRWSFLWQWWVASAETLKKPKISFSHMNFDKGCRSKLLWYTHESSIRRQEHS